MPGQFRIDDYVPVNERISQFYDAFPNGTIQSEIVELTDSRVTVKAYAYRAPDDPRPGVGHSSLDIPGSTPYTRGSEVENCETSAWGRAIAALGFEVKRGIASREEIQNKRSQPGSGERSLEASAKTPNPATYRRDELADLMARRGITTQALSRLADRVGIPKGERATPAQMDALIALIEEPASEPATEERGVGAPSPTPLPGLTEDEFDQLEAAVVPPRPGTERFKNLPAQERADARAYWQQQESA